MLPLNNNNDIWCVFQYYAVCKEVKYILNIQHYVHSTYLMLLNVINPGRPESYVHKDFI